MKYRLINIQTIRIPVALIFILLAFNCTDWKSKFYQSQMDLQECRRARSDSLIIMEDTVREFPPETAESDTFIIYGPADKIKTDVKTEYIRPSFTRKRQFIRQLDSLKVWLTIENKLIENQFIQRIKLDSVKYPIKTIIKTKNVPVEVDRTDYWKPVAIAAIVASTILIVGFFILLWRKIK